MMIVIAPNKESPEASPVAILVARTKLEKYGSSQDSAVVILELPLYTCSKSVVNDIISMLNWYEAYSNSYRLL